MRAYRMDYFQFSRDTKGTARKGRAARGESLPSSYLHLPPSPIPARPSSATTLFHGESDVFQGLIARASCPPFELRADRI